MISFGEGKALQVLCRLGISDCGDADRHARMVPRSSLKVEFEPPYMGTLVAPATRLVFRTRYPSRPGHTTALFRLTESCDRLP